MRTKYQIFVSSTYEDLKEERDLVIKAILEMGHFPVGMEMFSAGDEEQWKLIQKQIDECDYYIVIIAHRYGSLDGEISYTEKEYDYAIKQGVPTLGFIIDEEAKWPARKIDKSDKIVRKLSLFKSKVKAKLISTWNEKQDLYGKVSISLMKQFNTNARTGWVRANEFNSPEILQEVSRLSKENSELRKKNEEFELYKNQKELVQKTLNILHNITRNIKFFYIDSTKWENPRDYEFYRIFNLIAPELMIESTLDRCIDILAKMLNPNTQRKFRAPNPIPLNTVKSIMADLFVLSLIEPSTKKHSLKDANEYWTLTEFGKEIYKKIRGEIMLEPEVNQDKGPPK